MQTGLADRVVLITGASGGIGRALARGFHAEGCRLVLLAHGHLAELESFCEHEGFGASALCLAADVREHEEVDAAFARAREHFGRIDLGLVNAGVWPGEDRLLHELGVERLRDTLATNLLGAAFTARAFMAALAQDGAHPDGRGAALIFIGSTAGRFGERGHADYAMSKAGLEGLVRTLKNELPRLDPAARANLIEPGWTATEMGRAALDDDERLRAVARTMALRQMASAEDIARTALYLASPLLSRHVTGQAITVAGGMEGRLLWESEEVDPGEVRERTFRDDS